MHRLVFNIQAIAITRRKLFRETLYYFACPDEVFSLKDRLVVVSPFVRTITFMFVLRFKAAEYRVFGAVWNESQVHPPTWMPVESRSFI
jgi:hypothetical protein